MQKSSLPDKKYCWHMYTPQDSETSPEAIFRFKSKPAWNFTLQKRQYLCMEKPLQTKDFFKVQSEKQKKGKLKEKFEPD